MKPNSPKKCRICGGPLQTPLAGSLANTSSSNPTHVYDVDNGYVYKHAIRWCPKDKFLFLDHQREYIGTIQDVKETS